MDFLTESFENGHIVCLLFCALLIFTLCRAYEKSGRRRLFRLALAVLTAVLSLSRDVILRLRGEYGLNTLPLHLCSLTVYICLVHALCGKDILCRFLYAFCLPGAVFALLFPDRASFPESSFMAAAFYLLHSLPAAYVLMQAFAGELRPEAAQLPRLLLSLAALALPVYLFDLISGTNYMYLRFPPEMFSFLGPLFPLAYLLVGVFVWPLFAFWTKKAAD